MIFQNVSEIPISLKGRVAVKLHMGEDDGIPPVEPEDVRIIFEKIRKSGGEPFLVDTTVLYKSDRHTKEGYMKIAKLNGYSDFPILIADNSLYREIGGVRVSSEILEADSLLVLSHATGHILTGFAGAIKNIGMGCATKEGKRQIHGTTIPRYERDKCKSCGACIGVCPNNLVSFDTEKKIVIDYDYCSGCRRCARKCPTGALWYPENGVESSFRALCRTAKGVIDSFPGGNVVFINVLKKITPSCDCAGERKGEPVCRDIGYLVEDGPLKTDRKSVELIVKENPEPFDLNVWKDFEKQAKDFF